MVDPYAGLAHVHQTPCYDLLVSLRALFNPRTYDATRAWAAAARKQLTPEGEARGRFFFQGHDTSLGYGVTRLVAGLPQGAQPAALIEAVRSADTETLGLLMLDTDVTSDEARAAFSQALRGKATGRAIDRALKDEPAGWSKVCRRVLADPAWAQAELVLLLEEHLIAIFASEVEHVTAAIEAGARRAEELVAVVPTVVAIEQLAGGYTISPNLSLSRITLAPSAFIHPFVATRLDERSGEALIVFGAPSDSLERFDAVRIDPDLLKAVKALGDPRRLKLLRLLAQGPLTSTKLQSVVGLSAATVHHHLHQLRASGLVRQERTKGGMQYTIRRDSATELLAALTRLILDPD